MKESIENIPPLCVEHVVRPLENDELDEMILLSKRVGFPDPYVFYGQLRDYFNPENDILITLRDSKNILKGMTLGRVEGENIDVQVSIIDSDTQKKGYIKPIMDMFEDIARARGLKTMSWIDQTEHYADVSRRVYGDRIYKETKSHGGGATFRVTL